MISSFLDPPRIPDIKFNFENQGKDNCSPGKGKLNVREYTSFSMLCNTEAKPEASYSWYGPITSAFKDLEIRNVSRDKKGSYSCHAFNTMERTFGEIKTGESHVNVQLDVLCGY